MLLDWTYAEFVSSELGRVVDGLWTLDLFDSHEEVGNKARRFWKIRTFNICIIPKTSPYTQDLSLTTLSTPIGPITILSIGSKFSRMTWLPVATIFLLSLVLSRSIPSERISTDGRFDGYFLSFHPSLISPHCPSRCSLYRLGDQLTRFGYYSHSSKYSTALQMISV